MRVISRKWLNELAKKHPDAKPGLDAWFHEAEDADWANPAQIKAYFATASILKNGRVVFNIAGNRSVWLSASITRIAWFTFDSREHTLSTTALTRRKFDESENN